MASRGLLGRLTGRLRQALNLREAVGVDELGNRYWRQVEQQADGTPIERRYVEYVGDLDPTSLPAEWSQWLSRTRPASPSAEDLARGVAQRQQQQRYAAAADAEEARRRVREQTGGAAASPFQQQLPGRSNAGDS